MSWIGHARAGRTAATILGPVPCLCPPFLFLTCLGPGVGRLVLVPGLSGLGTSTSRRRSRVVWFLACLSPGVGGLVLVPGLGRLGTSPR